MSDNEFDTQLKAYYQRLDLRPEKLASLRAMAETNATAQSRGSKPTTDATVHHRWLWQRNLAIAATALICVISLFQLLQPSGISEDELAMLVSREIALNHNKGLLPEFEANDYAALSTQLDKLDFSLAQSERLQSSDYQLIGARYCSIHGQLATQIKLLNSQGELYTLYQTQLNTELGNLPENSYEVDGVQVQQWQEAGLFFSLAKSVE